MHNFEQNPQSYNSQFGFDQEEIKQEQFLPSSMDSYPPHEFSSDIFNNAAQDFKYEMLRLMSQSSMQQATAEAVPSLLSSASAPSVPSASSSTVGSPYSSHAQPITNQYIYANQYFPDPTKFCDDAFTYGYESAHFDHEATFVQELKTTGPFVGKCADLSSSVRGSAAMPVQEYLSSVPLVLSPKPIHTIPEDTAASSCKRARSYDGATHISVPVTSSGAQRQRGDELFKPPATPASAYSKMLSNSSPSANSVCFSSQTKKPFQLSYPFSPLQQPMQQHGRNAQYNLICQSYGILLPSSEPSCSSFLASGVWFHSLWSLVLNNC